MLAKELEDAIGAAIGDAIREFRRIGIINDNVADIIFRKVGSEDKNAILNEFEKIMRQYGTVNPRMINDFAVHVIKIYVQQWNNRNMNYNNYNNYNYYNPSPINTNLCGMSLANSNTNNFIINDENLKDALGAQNASRNARDIDQIRRNGNIDRVSEIREDKPKNTPKNLKGVGIIGNGVKEEELPTYVIDKGESYGNPKLINTELYHITDAYTVTQNNVSRTRISNVTLKKAVYSTEDAIAIMRDTRPDLFNADQYCVVLTYSKLIGYGIPGGADIIFDKGNKFKDISKDVTSMVQFTDKYEPALKELPDYLRRLVNKIYFTRFNLISEFCLWAPENSNLFINIDNWNRMGLFSTIQDIPDKKIREKLIQYIEIMKKTYGSKYQAAIFDIVKKTFNEVLCGDNGFIDIRKYHKEYVPVMPNVNVTLDNRYILRDLFLMPVEDQIKMLGKVARNYLIQQSKRTIIVTNMRLSSSLSANNVTIVVNNISELLNCLSIILDGVNTSNMNIKGINQTDLIVGQYLDNKNIPVECARLGLNLSGTMKLKRISA